LPAKGIAPEAKFARPFLTQIARTAQADIFLPQPIDTRSQVYASDARSDNVSVVLLEQILALY
jgi:hypothetical protein